MTAFNISNSTMSTILMQRSLADGVTSAPGGCLIGCWRRGQNDIVKKHEEGLRRWLDEMAQDQCGQSEEGVDSDGDFDADELENEEEIKGGEDVSSGLGHGVDMRGTARKRKRKRRSNATETRGPVPINMRAAAAKHLEAIACTRTT